MHARRTRVVALRVRRWRALLLLLWRAGRWRAVAVAALAAAQGLMPTGLILATGMLVAHAPGAVRDGLDSPAGGRAVVALGLVGAAFLGGAVLDAVTSYSVRLLDSRYAQTVHDTMARATLGTPGIAQLEDPTVANEIAALEEVERGGSLLTTASQLRQVVQGRTAGIGAFVVLLGFAWWAPLVLLGAWRTVSAMVTRLVEHGVEIGFSDVASSTLRRSRYLRGLAVESAAAKEVRVFGLASWIGTRYAESWLTSMRDIWRRRFADGVRSTAAVGAVAVAHALVLGMIGWSASQETITVAQAVVFVQAVLATESLGWLGDPQWDASRASVVAHRVLDLEHRLKPARLAPHGTRPAATTPRPEPTRPTANPTSAVVQAPTTTHRSSGPAAVRLSGVSFTYRGRPTPTLHGLDLEIPPGQSLAVVGENGAGKTTLIKLVCGLYEPDSGTVSLDGEPPLLARHRIGVIFQEFVRYELPLRANVGFGNLALTHDDDALRAALRDAGAADLLDTLPAGWDTVLAAGYDGGVDLSGGQWQKIALARALTAVRGGAGLLILDEPTASLDVRAETELFERFLDLTRDTTTILVSHRLASVRHADRIVVLADGRVVEDGSHDELRALGGRYDRMFRLQAERFTPGDGDGVGATGVTGRVGEPRA